MAAPVPYRSSRRAAALNVAGAATVARAERIVVAIKIAILLVFVAVGLTGISTTRLAPAHWNAPVSMIAGGMIIFLAYEGFELIANAAEDVTDPAATLGQTGFAIIAVAAMLSTASAINATLYGSARLTYVIAKSGQLPTELERPIWANLSRAYSSPPDRPSSWPT
ncbi:MAG: hypothetical protein M3Z25_05480 [Actinomycetota bacterium]|nr:hypothetical protein [Actinomycetota bacterium]